MKEQLRELHINRQWRFGYILWFGLSVALLAACGDAKANQTVDPKTMPPAIQQPDVVYPESVDLMYPQLKTLGLRLNSNDLLSRGSETPIQVLNFTDYQLNKQAADAVYNYFGTFRESTIRIPYNIVGRSRFFLLYPRSANQVRYRTFVITPEGTTRPNWPDMDPDDEAGTNIDNLGNTFSFVRTSRPQNSPFTTPQALLTAGVTSELCNQMIQVRVFDQDGILVSNPAETYVAQEVTCNSLGHVLASRLLGIPYTQYQQVVGNEGKLTVQLFNPDNGTRLNYTMVRFTQEQYTAVGVLGSILR